MPAASPLVKVLIAEPDPIAARILRLQLTRAGLAVTLAEDGPDAAACLRRERFDVLMMDLHPFGMTGDALLQTAHDTRGGRDPFGAYAPSAARQETLPMVRLGVWQDINPCVTWRANVARYGRFPSSSELYGDGHGLLSAPLLRPETGWNADISLAAMGEARVLLFGGEPLDGERFLWWNFVSSSRKRIAHAADGWKAGHFARVPGETEFIPLPDKAPTVADYP